MNAKYLLNGSKTLLMLFTVLAVMSGCCGTREVGPPIPIVELKDKWSKTQEVIINGQTRKVQCLTIEDQKRLYDYIGILESR